MIVANKNLIQLISKKFERPVSDGTNQPVYFLTFLSKFLLAGFPLYPEPSFGTARTVMRKPKGKSIVSEINTPQVR